MSGDGHRCDAAYRWPGMEIEVHSIAWIVGAKRSTCFGLGLGLVLGLIDWYLGVCYGLVFAKK